MRTLLRPFVLLAGSLLAMPASAQHALRFTSADNDRVTVQTSGISTGSFTYEIWVNYSAATYLGSYNTLIELGGDERTLYVMQDSTINLYGGSNGVQSTAKVMPRQWHHIACTYDDVAAEAKLYLDGALVQTALTSFPNSTESELGFGYHSGDTGWQGELDEVILWNSVRTAAQIQNDKRGMVTGTETGLVGYWKFDNGTGQTSPNRKTGGPVGTLGETATVELTDPQWTNSNILATPADLIALPLALTASPNPSAGSTTLTYSTRAAGRVSLAVFDATGRQVAALVDGEQAAGSHTVPLVAALPAGLYFCRLTTASGSAMRRLVLTN